jgi:hypothetical protein
MSESKPSDDASLIIKALSELGSCRCSRISREGACLRSRRQSVYRRHELDTGFGTERENFALDGKGNDKWQTPRGRIPMPERGAGLLVVVMKLL